MQAVLSQINIGSAPGHAIIKNPNGTLNRFIDRREADGKGQPVPVLEADGTGAPLAAGALLFCSMEDRVSADLAWEALTD